jgi:hypothetical protein
VIRRRQGVCTRRVAFRRDADAREQWELEGPPEAWEAEILFALPADDFVAYLSDDDSYTGSELDLARRAHESRSLESLARRPPLLAASLWEWLGRRGADARHPHAQVKPQSLLGR